MKSNSLTRRRHGFSLVALSVVVIIIGVLAAFGVPRILKSVKRSKASDAQTAPSRRETSKMLESAERSIATEAFRWLGSLRASQERYQARQGTFTATLTDLDVFSRTSWPDPPKYFTVGVVVAGTSGSLEDSWTLTLTRDGASSEFGAYTVVFSESGYDTVNSTIQALDNINPVAD